MLRSDPPGTRRLWSCDISRPCSSPCSCCSGPQPSPLPRRPRWSGPRRRRSSRRPAACDSARPWPTTLRLRAARPCAFAYQAGANGWSMVFSAPRMEMRGQVLFTFWLRAENLPPLTPGFMLTLVAHDKQTGQWAFHRQTRVYGVNLQAQGLHADHPGPGRAVDRRDLRPGSDPPVGRASEGRRSGHVSGQGRDRRPGVRRSARAGGLACEDSLPAPGAGDGAHLAGQSRLPRRSRGRWWARRSAPPIRAGKSSEKNVRLAAGEQKQVTSSYTLGAEEYGREIRVRLLVGGREVASRPGVLRRLEAPALGRRRLQRRPLVLGGQQRRPELLRRPRLRARIPGAACSTGRRCGGSTSSSSPGLRATSPTWPPPTTCSPAARDA